MDKKYLENYTNRVQKILKEKHGITVLKRDIYRVNVFYFKNIVYAMMHGYGVWIKNHVIFIPNLLKNIRKTRPGESTNSRP